VGSIRIQSEGAEAAHREAVGTLRKARRNLALLLDYPVQQADSLEVRGSLRPQGPSPPPDDQLIAAALESRPDVAAYRLGVARARADVRLAQANRYSDVYVTYTPYVFQNNAPFGTKSATSWSAAITAPLPLYNRNQGSIARAKLNVDQTVSGLDRLQKEVAAQVLDADQEYHLSREAVLEVERDQFPAARDILDGARRLYLEGQQSSPEFLDARRVYNETARLYRDVLVRHRRSMLDLNTALGRRVLP
jgi:cobalt-zinc-cadmium efflux system outer membrane protein